MLFNKSTMNSVDLMNIPLKIYPFQNIVENKTNLAMKIVGSMPETRN
jgi:hypothetical protein